MTDAATCATLVTMTAALAASLVALALVDSTSFGTLLIPIWFLVAPGRVRTGRVLVFLATVAGFYCLLGLALLAGATTVLSGDRQVLEGPAVAVGQLVLGVGLLTGSFFFGRKREGGRPRRTGRLVRWRERAMGEGGGRAGLGGVVGLALAAALLEAATMLPYLAAIALVGGAELGTAGRAAVVVLYCLVMVTPALLLLVARIALHDRVEPVLARIARWLERSSGETTAWVVGIVGFLLARDAAVRIPWVLDLLQRW